MTGLYPYLTFNGNCREAMTFYNKCLGGKLQMQTVKQSPLAGEWSENVQDHILHASLKLKRVVLLASDMGGSPVLTGGNISLALNCESQKQISFFFKGLSYEGKVTHPLHKFFNGTIGALTDKYGINWVLKL